MQNIATSWLEKIGCGPVGIHGMGVESLEYLVRYTPAMDGLTTVR